MFRPLALDKIKNLVYDILHNLVDDMTWQRLSHRIVALALSLMLILLAWVYYHQMMNTQSMASMAGHHTSPVSCLTFCFIAGKVDINNVIQSIYYSAVGAAERWELLHTLLALAVTLGWFIWRHIYSSSPPTITHLKHYYQNSHWRNRVTSLWVRLFQQGIIAPQIYS